MKTLITVLLLSVGAFAQGGFYQDRAEGRLINGNALVAIPGASVTVCSDQACVSPVNIYSNADLASGHLIGTSTTADANGNFSFYVLPGQYFCQVAASGFSTAINPCQVSITGPNLTGIANINNILYVGGLYPTITAAYNALPSTGGWIILPPGIYTMSSTLTLNKPTHIMGAGYTSPINFAPTPTLVNYTGSGQAFLINSVNGNQSVIEGFNLVNTGTGTIGVDLESNVDADVSGTLIEEMYISGFSTAGVDIGGNTTLHLTINTVLRDVYAANNGINYIIGLSADTTLDHVQGVNYSTLDVQIGDSTHQAFRVNITDNSDLEPNTTPNATVVQILNGESIKIDGDYFEQDGTGFSIDVPATATKVVGLSISDCRFRSGGDGNNSSFAFHSALASATWNIIGNYFTAYAPNANIIQNTAAQSIVMFGNVGDSSMLSIASASPTGVITHAGNILGGNLQDGARFQSTSTSPFIIEGTGLIQVLGTGIAFTNPLFLNTVPTISSGFGTSPSIVFSNGAAVFQLNVGTGGAATSGVIGLPTATNGWACLIQDMNTNIVTRQTAFTVSSVTVTAASAWTASDKLNIQCEAF
jgi:hypothetical protein